MPVCRIPVKDRLLQVVAYDSAARAGAGDFDESCLKETVEWSRPGERIGHRVVARDGWIPFEYTSAAAAYVFGGCIQEQNAHPSFPIRTRDEKAGHRPDRFFVDRLERAGTCEYRVVFSRFDGTPANRIAAVVREDTRNRAGIVPESTILWKACRFCSPFCFSKFLRGIRHHMHQQPPHAPRSPNKRSRSAQRSGVRV